VHVRIHHTFDERCSNARIDGIAATGEDASFGRADQ